MQQQQPQQPQEKSNVNYDAITPDPTGLEDPYDDAMAFKSLLGAVHSEFNHMVNENMVSESSTLQKVNGRAILEKGVKEIMGRQPVQSQIPPQVEQQVTPPPVPQPQIQQEQLFPQTSEPLPQEDPNQLTLNFDNTATAQDIFNKLDELEAKINKIIRLIDQPTKTTKKKTLVK